MTKDEAIATALIGAGLAVISVSVIAYKNREIERLKHREQVHAYKSEVLLETLMGVLDTATVDQCKFVTEKMEMESAFSKIVFDIKD